MAASNFPIRADFARALEKGLLLSLDTNCITVPIINPKYGTKSSPTNEYMNNSNLSNASMRVSDAESNEPAHKKRKRRASSLRFLSQLSASQQSMSLFELSQTNVAPQTNPNSNDAPSYSLEPINEMEQSPEAKEEVIATDVGFIDLTVSSQTPEFKFGLECKKCGILFKDKGKIIRHLRNDEEVSGSDGKLETFIKYQPSKAYHFNNERQNNANKERSNDDGNLSDSSLEILNKIEPWSFLEKIQINPMQIAFTIKSNRSWPKVIKIFNRNNARFRMKSKYKIDWNDDKNKAISTMIDIKESELRGFIPPKKSKTIRLKVNTQFIKEKGENIKNVEAELWISLVVKNCGGQNLWTKRPIKITFV